MHPVDLSVCSVDDPRPSRARAESLVTIVPSESPSTSSYIVKNASVTAIFSGLGVITGLILDGFILSLFGAGSQTDALFTALTVPLLIANVFSIQGPKILVPTFSDYLRRGEQVAAWDLLRNVLTVATCALLAISLSGAALSAVIVPIQIPGLPPSTISTAVWLSRVLFGLVLCQGLASILQSVLYAHHRYLVASSGKLVSNISTIVVLLLCRGAFGVQAVAFGMLLGAFAQVALLLWALSESNFQYRWRLDLRDATLRELVKSFRYPTTGHLLGEAGPILQNILGSFLGPGSVTVVRYASRIVQAIAGLLLGSVVQVTLPLMARHAVAKDLRAQRQTLLQSIQLLFLVGLPICTWLAFGAEPLVVLLFQRGAFLPSDAILTALVIRCMLPDIILGRLVSVSQTLFYANMDSRIPLISTLIFTLAHTVLAISLVPVIGLLGLPIAVSLASLSNAIYMLLQTDTRFGPVGWLELREFLVRLSAACAVGGLGFVGGWQLAAMMAAVPELFSRVIDVAIPTVVGSSSFIVAALFFRLFDGHVLPPLGRRTLQ